MTPRTEGPDAATRESVKRLLDLIQVLVPSRPSVVIAIERCVLSLVVDEMRHRIMDRLQQMSPEDIASVDALTAQLERNHRDEPPPEEGPDDAA